MFLKWAEYFNFWYTLCLYFNWSKIFNGIAIFIWVKNLNTSLFNFFAIKYILYLIKELSFLWLQAYFPILS